MKLSLPPRRNLLTVVVMVILFLSVNACRKTEFTNPEQELIQQAKANFESNLTFDDPKQIGVVSSNKKSKKEAKWDKAYTKQFAKQKVVIVPVLHDMSISLSTNGASHKLFYESYLYSYQNIQGDWNHELIYKIPNAEYLLNKNPNKRFSGRILIEDWEGNFVKGYRITTSNKILAIEIAEKQYSKQNIQSGYQCDIKNYEFCYWISTDGNRGVLKCDYWSVYECNENNEAPDATLAPDDYGQGSGGGGGGTSGSDGLELFNPGATVGDKPIAEYDDKCQGINDAWDNFPENEVAGYITKDGKLIITEILGYDGGERASPYLFQGTFYHPYPSVQGLPNNVNYITSPALGGTVLIEVVASFHTHTPCRNDGTNGVSHPVGPRDKISAGKAIGLLAVVQLLNSITSPLIFSMCKQVI